MLTDKEILALRPREKKYKVFDADGLFLVVHPKGGKYWYLKYHLGGKPKEVSLGTYPQVSLKLARTRRDDARKQLAEHKDPQIERRRTRAALGVLFKDVAEEWLTMMSTPPGRPGSRALTAVEQAEVAKALGEVPNAPITGATVKKLKWLLNDYLHPVLGERPLHEITGQDFNEQVLQPIVKKGNIETAHRARSLGSRIFCYAHATGRAPQGDITWSLRDALPPVKHRHHPAVTDPEGIGELLLAIDRYTGDPPTICALKLMPLTGLRTFELRFAQWSEFNFDVERNTTQKLEWRIPPERMKMPSPHIVPLSRQAVAVLYELKRHTGHGRYLFPVLGGREGDDEVISENTINDALHRMGYRRKHTGHGFRSLVSTLLNESQLWTPDAIERQLAHMPRKDEEIRATYNYAQYLPERRRMMQWLADHFDELREAARVRLSRSNRPSERRDRRSELHLAPAGDATND